MDENTKLEFLAAAIACGIVSSHGLDADAVAERSVAIALAIRNRVSATQLPPAAPTD
jgi:hypothetical protein